MSTMSTLTTNLRQTLQSRFQRIFVAASFKVGIKAFGITVLSMWVICEHVHFIKSPTDSMPEHYFVQLAKVTPKKGDLTLVHNQFYGGYLIKKIIGHAGDRLHRDRGGNLWVGGHFVGKIYPQTAKGQRLTPTPDQVIPEGRVFLYAPHPQSFDSRYIQVGLVHVNDLEGRLIAVA